MSELNPEEFIITRKRKKYKFALFFNSQLCFEFDDFLRLDQKPPIDVVEMGAGTGLFLVELAKRYPDKNYLAVDVKGDRLQKGAKKAEDLGLKNIWFLRARADQIDEFLNGQNIGQIWLTFSDPFPKKRSQGRRMTHANFLKKYAEVLASSGNLYIKHDNLSFFCWSLEQLVNAKWCIEELSFDLHESNLNEDYKIKTSYEEKWLQMGGIINFVKAKKEGL